MQPDPRYTVIMTQTIKARDLLGRPQYYGPLFIDDNSPQDGTDGPASFARMVQTVHDHFGDRDQITVDFADGAPGRVFDVDDDVVIHNILPGTDLAGTQSCE